MARYILLALNGPTEGEGHDEEYNKWYSEVHVKDLLATPGVVSAQRYKVVQGNVEWPYVAAYQIEADDLGDVFQALGKTAATFPTSSTAASRPTSSPSTWTTSKKPPADRPVRPSGSAPRPRPSGSLLLRCGVGSAPRPQRRGS